MNFVPSFNLATFAQSMHALQALILPGLAIGSAIVLTDAWYSRRQG